MSLSDNEYENFHTWGGRAACPRLLGCYYDAPFLGQRLLMLMQYCIPGDRHYRWQ